MAETPRFRWQVNITKPGERPDGWVAIKFRYDAELVAITKSFSGTRKWRDDAKEWAVPEGEFEELLAHFRQHQVHVMVSGIDQGRIKEMQAQVPTLCEEDQQDRMALIPAETLRKLFPYQLEGVRFGVLRSGMVLLADEPGLGKTVQAVLIAATFSEEWPLLIVCPAAVRNVWEYHLREWLPPDVLDRDSICNIASGKDATDLLQKMEASPGGKLKRNQITIVSYDQIPRTDAKLWQAHSFLICDESHMLKNHEARRTKALWPLAEKAKGCILISGTPLQGKPIELYTQVDMVSKGLLGSRDDYGRRYCGGQKTQLGGRGFNAPADYHGKSNEKELHCILESTIMVRRKKEDVLTELPDKIRCSVPVDVSPQHQKRLAQQRAAMDQVRADPTLPQAEKEQTGQLLLNELAKMTGQAKADGSIAYLLQLLESGRKVILFTHHLDILDQVEKALTNRTTHRYIRITGKTPPKDRQALCDQFQRDEQVRAALLTINATGVGVTLTAAEVVVFAEINWQVTALTQAEDRAHRVGQTKALQVHYMIATDTNSADALMWRTLKSKLVLAGSVVDGKFGDSSGLDLSAYVPLEGAPAADAGPSTPAEEASTQRRALSSPVQAKLSQDREAPGAPTKKRPGEKSLFHTILHNVLNEGQGAGHMAKRQKAAESEEQEPVIDLTQESVPMESQPLRASQLSREQQGVLASDDDEDVKHESVPVASQPIRTSQLSREEQGVLASDDDD